MLVVIVACMLPVVAYPTMLSEYSGNAAGSASDTKIFLWLYPLYVLAAGYLAWQCYGRRTYMTWILLVILLLTHAAMWMLLFQ